MSPVPGPHLSADDLDAWLAGTLAQPGLDHLVHCAECRDRVEAEREVVALLENLPLMSPAPGFADRVMQSVALPDPFALRSLDAIRQRALATRKTAALAATIAVLLVGSMTASIVWSLSHQQTLAALGSWLTSEAWQAGWVALRGAASTIIEQPWYAALRGSLEHPARWAALSAFASLAYVLGVLALRRLLALPAPRVAHANP
jgi:hypothetical protein